jgi:hypothetical protein
VLFLLQDCHPGDTNPAHQNQAWSVNANGTITEIMSGKCMDRSNYGTSPGTQVWLYQNTGEPIPPRITYLSLSFAPSCLRAWLVTCCAVRRSVQPAVDRAAGGRQHSRL